jgi:hypothetical protein
MAADAFNSLGGFTIGIPPLTVVDANGNITANKANIGNLTASIISSTGNITAPYFIGNIIGNISGHLVVPGTNTSVLFNNEGNAGASDAFQFDYTTNVVTVTGNITAANILTDNYLFANGAPFTFQATAAGSNNQLQFNLNGILDASANLTFDSTSNTFSTINVSAVEASINSIESEGITVYGNVTAEYFIGNLIGNVSNANIISANFLTGTLTTNAQPNITSVGTLSNLTVSGNINAANVIAVTNVTATSLGGTLTTALQPNITSVGTLSNLSVSGNVTVGNITGANLISANFLTGTLTTQTQSNIHTVGNLGFLNVDTIVANGNGNITFNGSMSGTGAQSNINVTGNITAGNILSTLVTGTLTTNDQPNIWAVGNLIDLTVQGPVDLGAISNITISGGSPNYVLTTDGAGNLSWSEQTGNGGGNGVPGGFNSYIQYNDNGNFAGSPNFTWNNNTQMLVVGGNTNILGRANAVTFVSSATTGTAPFTVLSTTTVTNLSAATSLTVTNNAQPNITSVGNLTSLNVTGNLSAGNLSLGGAFSVSGNFVAGNISTPGQTTTTGLTVTGNTTLGNVFVGNTKTVNVSGTFDTNSSSNVNLGIIGNIHIYGGINGQVLSTDGAGGLSWTTSGGGGGNGTPGGSNTQVQYNDAGVFGGSAFFTFDEATNTLQIAGNLIANTTQMGAGIYKFSTQYVYFATTSSTATDQIIWSVPVANVSGVDFHIIATDAAGSTRQSSKISTMVYGSNVVWNEFGSLQINGGTGTFSVVYVAGDIINPATLQLLVTPDSVNLTTYNMMITEYAP